MNFFIDIELSGVICVDADNEQAAIEIADLLSTDDIREYLLNYKTQIINDKNISLMKPKIFSSKDVC